MAHRAAREQLRCSQRRRGARDAARRLSLCHGGRTRPARPLTPNPNPNPNPNHTPYPEQAYWPSAPTTAGCSCSPPSGSAPPPPSSARCSSRPRRAHCSPAAC
eukprot:scaffold102272_cov24-Phaeocystis_antarctica.AAC.1